MPEANTILASYVHSTDEAERERLVEELMIVHAVPIVRLALRRQLGFHVGQQGDNQHNSDAADLFHEIMARILQRLRGAASGEGINDFPAYVNRTARNGCHDYLREKYPVRHLLKNKIRYLLTGHRGFNLWKSGQQATLCGLAEWGEREAAAAARDDDAIVEWVKSRGRMPLEKVVAEILRAAGGPLEIDRLVTLASRIVETPELAVESIDEEEAAFSERLADARPRADAWLEGRQNLERLWRAILRLPPLQRKIVICGRSFVADEDLPSRLLEQGIVTIGQLVEAMEVSRTDFARLWKHLPLDVTGLADYLGIARQQVIRGKFQALQRLKKSLAGQKG